MAGAETTRLQADAGRANFTGALLATTAGSYNLTFSVSGATATIADLVASEMRVEPAASVSLLLMQQPGGGEACEPLGSQPRLLVKDAYNNTTPLPDGDAIGASLVVGVDQPYSAAASQLTGSATQPVVAGGVAFGALGINETGHDWRVVFTLSSGVAAGADGAPLRATSEPFDCHGAPAALRMLPGWPPLLEVVDGGGLRATAVRGVPLRAYLEFPDGGLQQYGYLVQYLQDDGSVVMGTSIIEVGLDAAGAPRSSVDGAWEYDYATDPLRNATQAAAAIGLLFRANISATCCDLKLDETAHGALASLYVPPLRIVRLRAANTGRQGGYGAGDTVEVAFNVRTNRARLPLREVFDRTTVDRLLYSSTPLGDSPAAVSGVWTDNCTLLLIAGRNTSGASLLTGVTTVRMRDDVLELYDELEKLRMPSTAESVQMSGTFGAQEGRMGRYDPLRQALHTQALRRFEPPAGDSREGPLVWHQPTGDTLGQDPDDSLYGRSACELEAEGRLNGAKGSAQALATRYAERWDATEGFTDHERREFRRMTDFTGPPQPLERL